MSWLGTNPSQLFFYYSAEMVRAGTPIVTKPSLLARHGVCERNPAKLPRIHVAKYRMRFRIGD